MLEARREKEEREERAMEARRNKEEKRKRQKNEINIYVNARSIDSKLPLIALVVNNCESILRVKSMIASEVGISTQEMIICGGKGEELNDEDSLAVCNVVFGNMIYINRRC